MTGAELKTFVEGLVNDSPSDTWFYNALNAVKDRVECERNWEFLKKLDTSKTHPAGTTSSTTYVLPTDFGLPLRMSVGSDVSYRSLISMGDSRLLRDDNGSWFIDWANETFSFTGIESTGGTVYLLYTRFTPDIDAGTSPTWPDRFHRLLGYETAKEWFAQNAGERAFDWSKEHGQSAEMLRGSMILWDERLKVLSLNSSGTPLDRSNVPVVE